MFIPHPRSVERNGRKIDIAREVCYHTCRSDSTLRDSNPFRYRGYYYDTETGFYYLNSRYYDPVTGRLISMDDASVVTASPTALTDKNLFAYCDNNPVMRVDNGGEFWDIIFDVVSLVVSVVDVISDPTDGWAWAGLAGDALDLAIPFVGGIGEGIRAAKAIDGICDIADSAHDVGKIADNAAVAVKKGWHVGDDINALTKAGKTPSWSTVKQRYWKNEAFYNTSAYGEGDLLRMKKGLSPQIELNGRKYSMELHHITPRHKGGTHAYNNLQKVSPWMHAQIDPFRYFHP